MIFIHYIKFELKFLKICGLNHVIGNLIAIFDPN